MKTKKSRSGAGHEDSLLVVIDHREARVYTSTMAGTSPQRVGPDDPHGFGRALHYNQEDASGQRKPEQRSFYDAVAKALEGADRILLFGTGTGASSAMAQLQSNLESHHRQVADRVVGALAVDEHHLTENQLLAKARDFYASLVVAAP